VITRNDRGQTQPIVVNQRPRDTLPVDRLRVGRAFVSVLTTFSSSYRF
jgi:hypothetical protein